MAKTYTHINKESDGSESGGSAEYYSQSFTVGSWGGPISGYYFLTVPQSTHGKSNSVTATVFENVSGNFEEVELFVQVNGSFDVTIRIDATTDTRFAGKILIL